ncbi:MAG: [protein-PII] uridylyltransferase [Pseudomonadota bacterium]
MLPRYADIAAGAFPADLAHGLDQTAAGQALKEAYALGREQLFETYTKQPCDTRPLITSLSLLTDHATRSAFNIAGQLVGKDLSSEIAVIAVGGCGRGEMAPFSDVDLLFLISDTADPACNDVVEKTLYLLWDMKMKVGHATRTVSETLKLSEADVTIRTSVLENRFVHGNASLHQEMNDRLWSQLFSKTASDFVEQKLAERDDRHERNGAARYVLEPNVKEGKGGLRDLQALFWITKYVSGAHSLDDMVHEGYFTNDEKSAFEEAETFLWTVRCHLHLNAGRALEKLSFDQQVEIADRLGYQATEARAAVERFMQDFFRHTTTVGDLTRILLTKLEATHVKAKPTIQDRFRSFFAVRSKDVAPSGYRIEDGRLNISDPDAFLGDPVNIMRLFEEALKSKVLLHPDAMRIVSANLDLITEDLRANPEAQDIFLRTMLDYGNPERAMRRMNELGVLGKFIPEFERIIAMMQFNYYHHYTVDEHTIQCLKQLARIENGERSKRFPIVSDILKRGVNRRVLYVALLLHDIGKGLPQPHEIVGAEMAAEIAPRLGLDQSETDLVVWLVRHHLDMSDTAQKRDLSDPKTITDFAKFVQSVQRLNLLTALTVCDILGVGPGTLTAWKTELLRELYNNTRNALRDSGHDNLIIERVAEKQAEFSLALENAGIEAPTEGADRFYPAFWIGLDTASQVEFSRLLQSVEPDSIEMSLDADEGRDATRICFVLQDHPGIFSRLAGAIALAGMNVIDARTYTTTDGYATSVFWVQNNQGSAITERAPLDRLKSTIMKTLLGEVVAKTAIVSKDKIKKRERDIRMPTEITFDNDGSDLFTIIEVDARDRPGLLYDLTRMLADANIQIATATIATYGAQAVDTFYVKDIFGLKIRSPQKQATIAAKLKSAIEEGAERALTT